jgi:uncharacterized protein
MKPSERIKELETELKKTKYNKATQKAVGILKAKIAQLKEKQVVRSKSGPKGTGYSVSKSGDATVVLVGFPSVGKSTLLNALCGTKSDVGAYAFTTLTVIPGLLEYGGAKIQILDVPGIVQGAAAGTGRGKEVLGVMRSANLVILLLDVFHPEHLEILLKEVHDAYIRLNQVKPDITISRKDRGGLDIGTTVKLTNITTDTISGILNEFRISNAQVVIREDIDADQLIDVLEKNKVYVPSLTVVNKIDLVNSTKLNRVMNGVGGDIAVSGGEKLYLEELKEMIFKKLQFIRIYTKEIGKNADMNEPLILREGARIRDVCHKLHRDFVRKFRFARVWGDSAKFDAQKISLNHVVADGDVVEVHVM